MPKTHIIVTIDSNNHPDGDELEQIKRAFMEKIDSIFPCREGGSAFEFRIIHETRNPPLDYAWGTFQREIPGRFAALKREMQLFSLEAQREFQQLGREFEDALRRAKREGARNFHRYI